MSGNIEATQVGRSRLLVALRQSVEITILPLITILVQSVEIYLTCMHICTSGQVLVETNRITKVMGKDCVVLLCISFSRAKYFKRSKEYG